MKNDKTKNWDQFKKEFEMDETMEDEEGGEGGEGGEEILAEPRSSLEHPDYAALEEKLTLSEQQAHENWERSVRAMAELDNVRRRAEKDIANAHRYGIEKMIHSLLPVIDSLEQALQQVNKEEQPAVYEGLDLTMKLLLSALEKQGVTQLDPLGVVFNPEEHEAMTMQQVPGALPNEIVTVFQKGYKLADRVIRPARVIVAASS